MVEFEGMIFEEEIVVWKVKIEVEIIVKLMFEEMVGEVNEKIVIRKGMK